MSSKTRKVQKKVKAPVARMDVVRAIATKTNKLENVMVNLIKYLTDNGIIKTDDNQIVVPTVQQTQKISDTKEE